MSKFVLVSYMCLLMAGRGMAAEEPAGQRARLEQEFQDLLSGAELVGSFTASDAPADQPLQQDRYSIQKVSRLAGDLWRFDVRIRYGKRDVTVPVPLRVEWAGDTPVITLTDLSLPGLGTFTARVLFYRGEYAGTWSGGDHGGHMFGRVVPAAAVAALPPVAVPPQSLASMPFAAKPAAPALTASDWPQFRGASAQGIAEGHALADGFDVDSGSNIAWRIEVPGLAHSSPIVVGERIFVTTAIRKEDDAELKVGLYGDIDSVADEGPQVFALSCFDKRDGSPLWSRVGFDGVPRFKRHPKSSYAASTPVTDGTHVVAMFGSEGVICYDLDGEELWRVDPGPLDASFYMVKTAQWGFASSPVIHGDRLILQCDVLDGSSLRVLDVNNGQEVWRIDRDDVPTWSTPTVHVDATGRAQVVCNGLQEIAAYDLADGRQIWTLAGGGDIPVPTPVVSHGLAIITNAHGRMAPIYAIRTDASGELKMDPEECPSMAWSYDRFGNYMQTPIVYGDLLYMCFDAGTLAAYEVATGEPIYRQRLGAGRDGFTASMVGGDGKLYATSEEGVVYAIRAGEDFELIEVSELGEPCMATPAISAGTIYWRSQHYLTAVALPAADDDGGPR